MYRPVVATLRKVGLEWLANPMVWRPGGRMAQYSSHVGRGLGVSKKVQERLFGRTKEEENVQSRRMSSFLRGMMKQGQFVRAQQVFDTLGNGVGQDGMIKKNKWHYEIMVVGYCMGKRIGGAMRMLDEMVEKGFMPDLYVVNNMLHACAKCNKKGVAIALFERMIGDFQLEPDRYTYTIMLGVLDGNAEKLLPLVTSLERFGFLDNTESYGFALRSLCQSGQTKEAIALLRRMQSDHAIEPNHVMYSTLITGCGRERDLQTAEKLFHEALNTPGLEADQQLFGVYIRACIESGSLQRAVEVLSGMTHMRVRPDLQNFTMLLKACGEHREMGLAMSIVKQVNDNGLAPNNHIYNVLMEACGESGNAKDGVRVFVDMVKSGVQPNTVNFLTLLKLYGMQRDVDGAIYLLRDMRRYGLEPTKKIYNLLISICMSAGELQKGSQILEMMSERGMAPDLHSYTSVLKGLRKTKRAEESARVMERMTASGVRPDIKAFAIHIDTCIRAGDMYSAWETFARMKARKVEPNMFVYNLMIRCCVTDGRADKLEQLFVEMAAAKIALDKQSWYSLRLAPKSMKLGSLLQKTGLGNGGARRRAGQQRAAQRAAQGGRRGGRGARNHNKRGRKNAPRGAAEQEAK